MTTDFDPTLRRLEGKLHRLDDTTMSDGDYSLILKALRELDVAIQCALWAEKRRAT